MEFSKVKKSKAEVLEDIKESVDELNLVLADKLEARDADELLKEL